MAKRVTKRQRQYPWTIGTYIPNAGEIISGLPAKLTTIRPVKHTEAEAIAIYRRKWFERHEAMLGPITPFNYDRDLDPAALERVQRSEIETTTEALDEEVELQQTIDAGDDHVRHVVRRFIARIGNCLPTARAFDTTFSFPDGKTVPSFRNRIVGDLALVVRWQVGHADETMSSAARLMVNAGRHSEGTEIDEQVVEAAETTARYAQVRMQLWADADVGAQEAAAAFSTFTPLRPVKSREGHTDEAHLACMELVRDLGGRAECIIAYRLLWGARRAMRRQWRYITDRLEKGVGTKAQIEMGRQRAAVEMLGAVFADWYQRATGGQVTAEPPKGRVTVAKRHHVTAAWVKGDRKRVLAFAG